MMSTYRQQLLERTARGPCLWCGAQRSADHQLPGGRILWFCRCPGGGHVYHRSEAL